jgi:tRNA pseudouridine38-40 synthase
VGAGRTDAGVHALGQVMSTPDAPDYSDLTRLRDSLNSLCGPSIAVTSCDRVSDDFSARFSARSRLYVYAISTSPVIDPWTARTALHHPTPLDLPAMNEAAGHLTGAHDFKSFGRLRDSEASSDRVLYELRCTRDEDIIRIRARANSFLNQMVRSLVGTLLAIGESRLSPDAVPEIIAARDRGAAGPVAPPHGLCLVSVEYDSGWS